MKSNKIFLATFLSVLVISANYALAIEKTLSKTAAIALFTDKTFNGHQVIKDKKFRIYSASNGTHEVYFSNGKIKMKYWRINNRGEHCVSKRKGKGGRCSVVVSVGNGIYHKITNNEHTHTLSNFIEGNQN